MQPNQQQWQQPQYQQPQQYQQYQQPQQQQYQQPQQQQQYQQPQQQQYQQPQQPQQNQQPQQQTPQQQYQPQQYQDPQADQTRAAALAPEVNGVRWTWRTFPNATSAKQANKDVGVSAPPPLPPQMVVPLACMYQPLAASTTEEEYQADSTLPAPVAVVDRSTVAGTGEQIAVCKQCGAAWNCHCPVDASGRGFWVCAACLQRNTLPSNYRPDHPALHQNTVEYVIQASDEMARPVFLFVVDTCVPDEEFTALKQALLRCLEWLPSTAVVGLVTFGRCITVWELGFDNINKCYSLRGNKSYSNVDLLSRLDIGQQTGQAAGQGGAMAGATNTSVGGRFLVSLEQCEFNFNTIVDELSVDMLGVGPKERPHRATGVALEVATTLMELYGAGAAGTTCGKIVLFTGGPCTRGPGAIASLDRGELIRGAKDIAEGNAPLFASACEFYENLQQRLTEAKFSIDCFVQSYDQVGILEMRQCVDRTGGIFICGDSFTHHMFAQSLNRYFEVGAFNTTAEESAGFPAVVGFAADLRLFTSRDTVVCGCLGLCGKSPDKGDEQCVSPLIIGIGGTNRWRASTLDLNTTFTFLFDTTDTATPSGSGGNYTNPAPRFFQFWTTFTTICGEKRCRITSVTHPVAPTHDPSYFVQSQAFDQSCSAAVIARLAVSHMAKYESAGRAGGLDSARSWVDSLLIKFVRRFSTFNVGVASSLRLDASLALFPTFLFNLRRSEFFLVINVSPDETTFKRHFLFRENCDNCLLMIQPTVHSFSFDVPEGKPVPLDSSSIKPDAILLMDAFFNVHVMKGETIATWEQQGYQHNEDMAHFKQLLDLPQIQADEIVAQRHPYPRYSVTDEHGSDARHVVTRLNPSTSHNDAIGDGQHTVYTDQSSIAKFMTTLKEAVVAPVK